MTARRESKRRISYPCQLVERYCHSSGGQVSTYRTEKMTSVASIPTRPPTTFVHTRLVDNTGGDVHYLPTACKKNQRLRFSPQHARQFQCVCPSCLGRPFRFSAFATLHHLHASTGILWYATFDIAQSHKGFAKNCESHNVTSPLVTRVTHVFWRKCQSYNFTSTFYLEE